jgi:hypothetical protein
MIKSIMIMVLLCLIGSLFTSGCYNKPPGPEPQKPAEQSSEQ